MGTDAIKELLKEEASRNMHARSFDVEDDEPTPVSHREHSMSASRVSSDVQNLKAKIRSAHLPHSRELEVMDNLKHIEADAMKVAGLDHCVGSECKSRDNIRKALSLRMKALHKELEENDSPKVRAFEADDALSKIKADVNRFKQALSDAVMPQKAKKEVKENLDQISRDAEEYSESDDSTRRSHLKKAISLRMQALHKVRAFEAEDEDANEADEEKKDEDQSAASLFASKIMADVNRFKQALSDAVMPQKAKKEVKENLNQISRDAEEYSESDDSTRRSHLKKAISLRMQALHKELENEPVSAKRHAAATAKPSANTAKKIKAVEADLTAIEKKIASTTLSKAVKSEVND